MIRPCYLVVDREHAASISTRKLVIETAKLNVITAYSAAEAIETLSTFPNVTGAVLDAGLEDMPCGELVRRLKAIQPKIPIIVIGTPSQHRCSDEDHVLNSFEPQELLALLKRLEPEKTAVTEKDKA